VLKNKTNFMTNAVITGWGKCLPPTRLTNADLSQVMDTSDEWITTRTGIKERRICHVNTSDMAYVAAQRALDAAGVDALDVDLIILATCTPDTLIPNAVSKVQLKLGATNAAALDINTACSGFLYGLTLARGQIGMGMHKKVLVIGAERLTAYMDWSYRQTAVLFGDGAGAVLLEADEQEPGILASAVGNDSEAADFLKMPGFGTDMDRFAADAGAITVLMSGQDVFKRAVHGMSRTSAEVLAKANLTHEQVDLIIPHQANIRIIDSVVKKLGADRKKAFVNIQKYGNTSAATIPIALTEALEDGSIQPNSTILLTAFGAGLSVAAVALKWIDRVTPLKTSKVDLPECDKTALELISASVEFYKQHSKHKD
jgi:3-oxoacyl-[acyl-carrier-protein] synthase III